jgi:hypothetical protein
MAKRKIIWLIIIAAAAYSLFSCGSSLEVPEGVYSSPSFYFHIQPIFTQNCVANGCHNSAAGGGLVLLQGPAYVNLVNIPSTQEPNRMRVLPGDAANSYMIIKIEGNQTIGTRMPLGREPLDQVLIQNLINWVNKGAMNN